MRSVHDVRQWIHHNRWQQSATEEAEAHTFSPFNELYKYFTHPNEPINPHVNALWSCSPISYAHVLRISRINVSWCFVAWEGACLSEGDSNGPCLHVLPSLNPSLNPRLWAISADILLPGLDGLIWGLFSFMSMPTAQVMVNRMRKLVPNSGTTSNTDSYHCISFLDGTNR